MPDKPGFKTTEWWISVVVVAATLFLSSGAVGDTSPVTKIVGLVVSGLTALGYGWGRVSLKKGSPNG